MASELTPEERLALIRRQLAEDLRFDLIEKVIQKGERPLVIYWGTATTGRPHCGYFVAMVKLAHFLQAGCEVKVLIADLHGMLDSIKVGFELVKNRATYYKFLIQSMLKTIGVPLDKLVFVLGSSYQLSSEYMLDTMRMCANVSERQAKKAGAAVVKQSDDPLVASLVYPIMQALDEQYLGVDAQFGGVDQRKIFAFAGEQMPKLGYRKRAYLMNPMVPGMAGDKMSSSNPDSKIDVLESSNGVAKKVKKAFILPKVVEANGLVAFIKFVLLPVSELQNGKPKFVVEQKEGEPLVYESIEAVEQDYTVDKLTPQLLKAGVTAALNKLLEPIREEYQGSKEWQEADKASRFSS